MLFLDLSFNKAKLVLKEPALGQNLLKNQLQGYLESSIFMLKVKKEDVPL